MTINDCIYDQNIIETISKSAKNLKSLTIYGYIIQDKIEESFDFELQTMKNLYFPYLTTLKLCPGDKFLCDTDEEELEPMFLDEEMEFGGNRRMDNLMQNLNRHINEANN